MNEMKQLGALALVCARKPEIAFQVFNGTVTVFVGQGPQRAVLSSDWDNDEMIRQIIQELNFGKYAPKQAATEMRYGTCSIMQRLNEAANTLGRKKGCRLEMRDVEPIRTLLCGYICNGVCREEFMKK